MYLNKMPTINTPKPVIFGAGIFLAAFYFWLTQPAKESSSNGGNRPKP